MNNSVRWVLWTALAVAGSVLGFPGPIHAQSANEPKTIFTNKNSFRMPVNIDDHTRGDLKEVYLYVKHGSADWARQEAAPAAVKVFTYRVSQDGEYWFSVATMDKGGRMIPSDIGAQPPALKVVVDTIPPALDLKSANGPDGEPCVQCVVQDAHPDYQSIQVSYLDRDGAERGLERHPYRPGYFHVPDPSFWGTMVRVSAADRCGNRITREMRLSNLANAPAATAPAATAPAATAPAANAPAATAPAANAPAANAPAATAPAATASTLAENVSKSQPLQATTFQEKSRPDKLAVPEVTPSSSPAAGPQLPAAIPNLNAMPTTEVEARGLNRVGESPSQPAADSEAPASAPSNRLLLNTQHASLEYRIDQVGPSGVSKVELWLSADNGKNWKRLCEDKDRHSPADIDLPSEGVFGVRLAVANGNGFGGAPPEPGDAPTTSIEVDTTPPSIQLANVEPVTQDGSLEIRWKASDKNLASDAVSLYYRTRADGPWKIITRNLKNDGSYRWALPHDMGSKFFFKIEVTDLAGNPAQAESHNAVVLDLTEPRASVISVTGISARKD